MSIGIKEALITPEAKPEDPELIPPSEDADYIDLGHYIKRHLLAGDRMEEEVKGFGCKASIHRFYAGEALKRVWSKESKDRKWVVWCENHSLNVGTCYEAMRLYERAVSVENVKKLTITEARKKYQTNKKSFFPPGQTPPPKKVAEKKVNTRKYTETATLSKMKLEMETIGDTVGGATTEDWTNADPDRFIGQINKLIEMLSSAKKAIRDAQKATKTPTKPRSKPKPILQASVDEVKPSRTDDHEMPHETPAVPKTARNRRA